MGRDFRSFANHMTVAKVEGEYTGFNEALAKMDYIPFLSEYLYDPPIVLRHKRHERDIPGFREMKPSGFEERERCRKLKGWY